MQSTKDSVYVALRDRLAAINPERVIAIEGISRPAVLVAENQAVSLQTTISLVRNAFELQWGASEMVAAGQSAGRPLMKLELRIFYNVEGADPTGGDRGHALGTMDSELFQMCMPRHTPKQDYTQAEPIPLGSTVFWSDPQFSEPSDDAGVLRRTARFSVFYFSEVEAA
jgi:hypothetical protein